jgi:hypothetical protein
LSIYDIEQAKVMAQVHVGRKENEITKAPKVLKMVEISRKIITGDAMHTQRGLAAQILQAQADYVLPVKENQPQLYKNIQSLFAPDYPKPGFGKIQTDFLTVQKVNKGHTCTCGASAGVVASKFAPSRPAKCSTPMQLGQVWHRSIVWNANSTGGGMDAAIAALANLNSVLPA